MLVDIIQRMFHLDNDVDEEINEDILKRDKYILNLKTILSIPINMVYMHTTYKFLKGHTISFVCTQNDPCIILNLDYILIGISFFEICVNILTRFMWYLGYTSSIKRKVEWGNWANECVAYPVYTTIIFNRIGIDNMLYSMIIASLCVFSIVCNFIVHYLSVVYLCNQVKREWSIPPSTRVWLWCLCSVATVLLCAIGTLHIVMQNKCANALPQHLEMYLWLHVGKEMCNRVCCLLKLYNSVKNVNLYVVYQFIIEKVFYSVILYKLVEEIIPPMNVSFDSCLIPPWGVAPWEGNWA